MRGDVKIGIELTLRVGCPVSCSYCPQKLFLSKYKGEREFTLESLKRTFEVGQVPITKNITVMGFSEPFQARDCAKIIRWIHNRGHGCSISTTLVGITHQDIDDLADIPFTDSVIHVPANDGCMHIDVTDEYCELFRHVIKAWRHHPDFVISVFNNPPHPKLYPIWVESGVHIPCNGLHDRAGLLPDLNAPYVKHGPNVGKLQICGKQFNGHILPNSDCIRCCNDWGMACVWGNLLETTYYDMYHSPKFRAYIKSLEDPNSTPPCRWCHDGYKQTNVEDRNKGYDLVGH